MSIELINTGAFPNDATGDPLQTAFEKCNSNFSQLFAVPSGNVGVNLIPTPSNTLTLGSPSSSFANLYLGPNEAPAFDPNTGNIAFYARTPAEISAGVIPTNFSYPEGYVDRYGTNTQPLITDMTNATKAAVSVALQSTSIRAVTFLGTGYLVTDTCITVTNGAPLLVIQGVPLRTIISNKAAANKPTIRMIDAQYWDIFGLVLIGNATFPNVGISVESAGGQRCAYFNIQNVVCNMNGGGIHLRDCNTAWITGYQYWPSGSAVFGATADTNGQPYGILSDGATAVNSIHLKNINISGLNLIANDATAAGIKVDGTNSGGSPFQGWTIDSLDAERLGTRAIWLRNANVFTINVAFTENAEVRIDANSIRGTITGLEAASTGTIVIDGTQPLGGCRQIDFISCQAKSIVADSANAETVHIGCSYSGSPGFADSSVNARWINTETTGSVLMADQYNSFYRFRNTALTRTTNTLADDPTLIVTAVAPGTYLVRGLLEIQGLTTGTQGFQFAFRIGGTQTGASWIITQGVINGAASTPNNIRGVSTTITFATISTTANTDGISFEGIVSTSTIGDIAIQWSENSASANGTQLNDRSWLKVEKIG